jgi:hypothetical protein
VLESLRNDAALKAELSQAGVADMPENLSTLALHACREAAIACARAKRND